MGQEFRINVGQEGWQRNPDVVVFGDGSFFVTWDSIFFDFDAYGVIGRLFSANGTPLSGEFLLDGNEGSASTDARVARLSNGNIAVTFTYGPDGLLDSDQSWVRAFDPRANPDDPAGNPVFNARRVDTINVTDASDSNVIGLKNGGFMVFYTGDAAGVNFPNVYGREFNANGVAQGREFLVNKNAPKFNQGSPEVADLKGDRIIVVWSSVGTYNAGGVEAGAELRASIFAGNGNVIRSDFRLSRDFGGISELPFSNGPNDDFGLTALNNGGFAITRYVVDLNGNGPTKFGFNMQIFNNAGNSVTGSKVAFRTTEGVAENSQLVQLSNGRILMVWDQPSERAGDPYADVRGKIFNANGNAVTGVFEIAQYRVEDQENPRIEALKNGAYIVVWQSDAIDNDYEGISARIFGQGTNAAERLEVDQAPIMAGLDGNDTIAGDAVRNLLAGNRGDDLLRGGDGSDRLSGGEGNDLLQGGTGDDRLTGGIGQDTLQGGPGNDTFVFSTDPRLAGGPDLISDFGDGDIIALSAKWFADIGPKGALDPSRFAMLGGAMGAEDRIIYDGDSGTLYYDANGASAGGRFAIAVLSDAPMIAATDIFVV
jgi:Ca2+-binding RTX toxin-like protein